MRMDVSMPKFDDGTAESRCAHFNECSKLDITTQTCMKGGSKLTRCNQGQYATITLLGRIVKNQMNEQPE